MWYLAVIFFRIGGPEWTAVRVRGVQRDLRPMSRRSARRGAMPTEADGRLLPGPVDADRAQECRADGGSDSTGAGRREASILAAFCGQCTMVGRCDAGQGGPARVAGDRA